MPKRLTATEIWGEDWFINMPKDYRLFWFYMLAMCDHAGFFKVNTKNFCSLHEAQVVPEQAIKFFNEGKDRVRVLNGGSVWFVEEFFVFQYGHVFNEKNKVHESVAKLWKKNGVTRASIKGLERG